MNSSAKVEHPAWQDFSRAAEAQRVPASGEAEMPSPAPVVSAPNSFTPLLGAQDPNKPQENGIPQVHTVTPVSMTTPPADAAIIAKAVEQADEILNTACMEAATVLQEAADIADTAAKEGHAEGLERGKQDGLEAAQAEMNAFRQELEASIAQQRTELERAQRLVEAERQAILSKADAEAQAILSQARQEAYAEQARRLDDAQVALSELAVAAAIRLVQGQLAVRPESIINMVAGGLRRLKDTQCTVHVRPEDLPLLEAQKAQLESALGAAGTLHIGADPTMSLGDYLINSSQGQIDARMSQQVNHIRSAMKTALGG